MPKGRQTRTLSLDQIRRLQKFRHASHDGARSGYSLPQLQSAMAAPFGWETLRNALAGRPVWDLSHSYIVQWLDRFVPADPPVRCGKDAAAGNGESPEEENGEGEAARIIRGSR